MEEEKQRQKQLRVKDLYDALLVNVQAIRLNNLPADTWTSSVPIELVPPAQLEQNDDDELPPLPAPDLDINNEAVDAVAILAITNLDLDATDPAVIRTMPNLDLATNTDAAVELDVSEALLLFASANEAL